MKMPKRLLAILSTFMLVVASFFVSTNPALAEKYVVKMGTDTGLLKFVPETITVQPGDTIEFEMNKLAPHNAVFSKVPNGDPTLAKTLSHQKLMFAPGESYTSTIPEDAPAGEYDYFCQPHRGAGMVGKVIVEK